MKVFNISLQTKGFFICKCISEVLDCRRILDFAMRTGENLQQREEEDRRVEK